MLSMTKKFNAEAGPEPSHDELLKFWDWIKTGDARVEAAAAFLDRYPQAVTVPLTDESSDWSLEPGILPLHYAAKQGDCIHPRMIELLIQRGAPVNGRDPWQRTPLHVYTTWNPNRGIGTMRILLEHGADPNAQDCEGKTALLNAADNSYAEQAEILLNAGADPNLADNEGRTPLMAIAAYMAKDYFSDIRFVPQPGPTSAFVKALIDHGARATDARGPKSAAVLLAKKALKQDKRLVAACNMIIDKAQGENAEGVAREAATLAESGTQRKTRALPRLKLKPR
jgi:hypothetical protein